MIDRAATRLSQLMSRLPWLSGLDSRMRNVIQATSGAIVLRLLRSGASFVVNLLLARLLGAEGAGVYFLAYTVTRIATVVARVGLDQALVRFTARHAAQGEWDRIAGLYRHSLLIAGGMSLAATAIVWTAVPVFAQVIFDEPDLVIPLRWMALSILPWSLLLLHSQLLLGLERVRYAILVQGIGLPLVNIPVLVAFGLTLGVTGAAISYVIATFLVLLLGVVLWRRATPQLRDLVGRYPTRQLLETSVPLFWMDFTIIVVGMTDTLLLGVLDASDSVGIYNAVKRLAVLTSLVLDAINVVVAPKFARIYTQEGVGPLGRLARDSARFVTLLAIPYVLIFTLVPGPILSIFGEEYRAGAASLAVLAVGQLVNAATGSVGYLLIMTGHEKLSRNNSVATGVLNITLLLLLIPPLGVFGAALATAASDIVRNLVAMGLVYWKLSILTLPLPEGLLGRLGLATSQPQPGFGQGGGAMSGESDVE